MKNRRNIVVFMILILIWLVGINLLSLIPIKAQVDLITEKEYNDTKKEITIKDDITKEVLLKAQLYSQLNEKVIRGRDRKVAEFNINSYDKKLDEILKDMTFYDLNDNKYDDRKFTYKYKVENGVRAIPIQKLVCKLTGEKNKSENKDDIECHYEIDKYEYVKLYKWEIMDFNDLDKIAEKNFTVGIFADVYAGDYIEWTPTFLDKEITEWATWTESLNNSLVLYYPMNNLEETISHIYNLTNFEGAPSFSTVNCKIGMCVNITNDNNLKIFNVSNTDIFVPRLHNKTWNFWVWENSTGAARYIFYRAYTIENNYIAIDSTYHFEFGRWDIPPNVTPVSLLTIDPLNIWTMVSMVVNDTGTAFYRNGSFEMSWGISENYSIDGADTFFVGVHSSGVDASNFRGFLDEMAFWNRSLSSNEIAQLWNNGDGINLSYDFYPLVTINFPQNVTYNYNNLPLNFNVSLDIRGSIQYSLNNGIINVTMTGDEGNVFGKSFNHTNSSIADGSYIFNVYANATNGLTNYTSKVTFSFEGTLPLITINYPQLDGINLSLNTIIFNVSLNENGACLYSLNNGITNITMQNNGNRNFNHTNISIADGLYTTKYFCNDSFNNWNRTVSRVFRKDTITPNISIVSISTAIGSQTFSFNSTLNDDIFSNICWYAVYELDGDVNGDNNNRTIACNSLITGKTVTKFGDYYLYVYGNDSSGNYNQTNQSFSIIAGESSAGGGGGGGGAAEERPIIIIAGNLSWSIETDLGGSKYQLSMSKGDERTKQLIFKNLDVSEVNIKLDCVDVNGSICQYVTFEDNSFALITQRDIPVSTTFTVTLPNLIENGIYKFNIIATDQNGNYGVLTTQVNVGFFGELFNIGKKILSSTEISSKAFIPFGFKIYNFFLLFIGVSILSIFVYYTLFSKLTLGIPLAIFMSVIINIIILLFLPQQINL